MRLQPLPAICAALALSPSVATAEETFARKTFTYKTEGDLAIQADVYRAEDDKVRPVLAWLHGGALIVGSRADVPRRLLDLCRQEGFVLVSFDYRLAPETRLPAIIEDLEDACRWLHRDGPRLLRIDPGRLVVAGGSAGGYLAMTAGARARPRPRAVVSYWGYGDVDGDWYTKPSDFYRTQSPLVEKEEAYRPIGSRALAGTEGGSPEQKARGRYYLYHGPTPALLAFAPYRLLTGYDLPESFAAFAFCWGGFLFASATMLRLFDAADARPGAWAAGLLTFSMGIAPAVPYLLRRVWVYETAIACGWLCVAAAVYCFARSAGSPREAAWLAGSGAMFALAIGCRPHLGFAGLLFFVGDDTDVEDRRGDHAEREPERQPDPRPLQP